MSKVVLIVSNAPAQECDLLRNTCARVRTLIQNNVSGYYGSEFKNFALSDKLDSTEIGFVLLGLTPESRRSESAGFKAEHRLMKQVLDQKIPMGIICDTSSRITAPHLVGGVLELVRIVGTRAVETTCAPGDVYPNAHLILDPKLDIHVEIAEQVASILGPKRLPHSESVPRQMAAEIPREGGWQHPQMTD